MGPPLVRIGGPHGPPDPTILSTYVLRKSGWPPGPAGEHPAVPGGGRDDVNRSPRWRTAVRVAWTSPPPDRRWSTRAPTRPARLHLGLVVPVHQGDRGALLAAVRGLEPGRARLRRGAGVPLRRRRAHARAPLVGPPRRARPCHERDAVHHDRLGRGAHHLRVGLGAECHHTAVRRGLLRLAAARPAAPTRTASSRASLPSGWPPASSPWPAYCSPRAPPWSWHTGRSSSPRWWPSACSCSAGSGPATPTCSTTASSRTSV